MPNYCLAAILFLALILYAIPGKAQFTGKPSLFLDTIPQEIWERMNNKLVAENEAITIDRSKLKAFIKTLNKDRVDCVVKLFNEDWLIGDSELNRHVTSIFKILVLSNPQIPQDESLYLYRSNSPNAISYGEGTILISVALLSRLENDAQVAFVLSHELAHYYLDHTKMAIERFAQLNFDKDINREAKSIRNSQYERYSRMKELMKGIELSLNKHSRAHEFEADSVGLQLFFNSPYADTSAPVRTMQLLDSVDYPMYTTPLNLKKRFDFKEYPFKDSWLTYKKSSTWHANKEVSDTAQTHPSCQLRGLALKAQINRQFGTVHFVGQNFDSVKFQARLDLIEANYHFKNYGKALYEAIHLTEIFPNNAYLHAMIGKCFYQLYFGQINHELGKALELPDPRFPEIYDRFLTFMHSLRLRDLENIAYYYVITQDERFFEDEEFLHALWLCSRLPVSKLSTSSVEEDYKRLFPHGKYDQQMK